MSEVKLRYFTGLENQEIAQALAISLSTIERSWAYARSWLFREMKKIYPRAEGFFVQTTH